MMYSNHYLNKILKNIKNYKYFQYKKYVFNFKT